jgi:hypothetical protein
MPRKQSETILEYPTLVLTQIVAEYLQESSSTWPKSKQLELVQCHSVLQGWADSW